MHVIFVILYSFMGKKWSLSANLMVIAFKFIKMVQKYTTSQGGCRFASNYSLYLSSFVSEVFNSKLLYLISDIYTFYFNLLL